jgi:hypothetical protein
MGLILIGNFIYRAFGINFTILYAGIIFVFASLIFGLLDIKPKQKLNGR